MTNEEIIKRASENEHDFANAKEAFIAGAIWALNIKDQELEDIGLDSKNVTLIEVDDWDKLVSETYNRPYSFQQQEGCKERGIFELDVPSDETADDIMNDEIPEIVNGEIMGVKFEKWLERDPNLPVGDGSYLDLELWWDRNFYPDINTVANDLYNKGLLRAGTYLINIDW